MESAGIVKEVIITASARQGMKNFDVLLYKQIKNRSDANIKGLKNSMKLNECKKSLSSKKIK